METSKIAMPIGTVLDRFIKNRQEAFPFATGELSQLLRDIALSAKVVNREINRAGLINLSGIAGSQNATGEEQKQLDILANIRFSRALQKGGEVCAIISEEEKEIIKVNNNSSYIIAIDPLDGSSNIDVNVSIGTIFSIYRRVSSIGSPIIKKDVLQPGKNQIVAGYILYGSSTMLIFTTGMGVNGFTYDPSLGEYFLSHSNMRIPENGKIYSINDGFYNNFTQGVKNYIKDCRDNNFSGRYIGSLVADFHRNLLKGGIYIYPATVANPSGKLRLIYECSTLALIAEQAGGKATNGIDRILDIVPTDIHQRIPLFIGSKEMVDKARTFNI